MNCKAPPGYFLFISVRQAKFITLDNVPSRILQIKWCLAIAFDLGVPSVWWDELVFHICFYEYIFTVEELLLDDPRARQVLRCVDTFKLNNSDGLLGR